MQAKNKMLTSYSFILITAFTLLTATPLIASTVKGGAMTINIDNTALASAFTHNTDPNRSSFYLEEYFNSAQAASLNNAGLLTTHIVPDTGEISGINRQLAVNDSTTSGSNQATNFTFDASDLSATAAGAIGLGGALRYRLNIPFSISAGGEEVGNRTMTAFFSLEYDTNEVDIVAGHSGWNLFNHYSFRSKVFSLDNVMTTLTADTLLLTGDLSLASGFNHLGGQQGTIIGDFSFQTAVVPVPAAIWLFASGLTGLGVLRQRKKYSQVV